MILYRKIQKLSAKWDEVEKTNDNPELLIKLSSSLGYLIQVQNGYITRVEDIDMLEKMEGIEKDDSVTTVQETPTIESTDRIF